MFYDKLTAASERFPGDPNEEQVSLGSTTEKYFPQPFPTVHKISASGGSGVGKFLVDIR